MINNPFSLQNKNILITGGSGGIGAQCAISCSNLGANVIIIGRDETRLNETFSKLNKRNNLIIKQDITDFSSFDNLISECITKIGYLDGFIHAAGIELTLPLKLHDANSYLNQYKVNAISAFEIIKTLTKKKYLNKSGGSYIIISSIMGLLGQGGQVGYCSSKGAITSAVKALAIELAKSKIRINAVLPGMVENTQMTESLLNTLPKESIQQSKLDHLLGWCLPEDVANACLFLLSDASKMITGTNLIVDGGYSSH